MNAQTGFEPPFGPAPRFRARIPRDQYAYAGLEGETDAVEVDIQSLWTTVRRNAAAIAGIVAFALAAGGASIVLTTPQYRADASVQVDAQSTKVLNSEDLEPVVTGLETERFIRTQMDIVRSRSLAASVAKSQGLLDDIDFFSADDVRSDRAREVVDRVLERLSVEMLPNSRVVRISFVDSDPERAARVANAFATGVIDHNLKRKQGTSAQSQRLLGGQLAEAKKRLEDAERATIAYARSAGLLDASAGATRRLDGGTPSLTTASLVQLNDAYSASRANRIMAQKRWEQISKADALSIPEVLANPAVQQLAKDRAELRGQLQDQRQRRKADHPVVKQLSARIAETDRQIGGLAGSVRRSVNEQYQIALGQERALLSDVNRLKQDTLGEQDRGVQYNILKRETDTSREMYDALLQRYKEISAAAGIVNNNVSLVDEAEPPVRPVSPIAWLNMLVALFAGLSIALIGIFARERFVDSIRDGDDMQRKLGLPVLGIVPKLGPQSDPRDALANPRSNFSEAHYSICTALEFSSNAGLPKSIMLTSSQPGEGKSTAALAFASSLAELGKRVVLVDADMRRPSLHKLLNIRPDLGLVHLLTRKATIAQVIYPTRLPGVHFIASGPLPPSPATLIAGPAMRPVLDELASKFDVVIIDAPPVMGLADAPRLSSIVEATVFLIQANGAPASVVKQALQRLDDSRARIVGLVLTKCTTSLERRRDYYYGSGEIPRPATDAGFAEHDADRDGVPVPA